MSVRSDFRLNSMELLRGVNLTSLQANIRVMPFTGIKGGCVHSRLQVGIKYNLALPYRSGITSYHSYHGDTVKT